MRHIKLPYNLNLLESALTMTITWFIVMGVLYLFHFPIPEDYIFGATVGVWVFAIVNTRKIFLVVRQMERAVSFGDENLKGELKCSVSKL